MKRTLILIRTPFQAYVCRMVIERLNISEYDLAYFTQDDSEEDQYYFSLLSEKAQVKKYIYAKPARKEIFNLVKFLAKNRFSRFEYNLYDRILLASIEFPVFNKILAVADNTELITFDDGVANIYESSRYRSENIGWREKIYFKLIGAIEINAVKARINEHFSLYPGYENIVHQNRITFLDPTFNHQITNDAKSLTFFIGAPFDRFYSNQQLENLGSIAKLFRPDFYVKHPQERKVLLPDVLQLEKNGLIAEEAIIKIASGRSIALIGSASTVMLNLAGVAASKTIIVPKTLKHVGLLNILTARDCKIIKI